MIVEIVSPKKIIFSQNTDLIIVPGADGDFGILENHTPLVSNLRVGLIYIYEKDKIIKKFYIVDGVCEISSNLCTILTENAEDITDNNISSKQADFDSEIKKNIINKQFYS